jgi:glycosyltransferase involved in cell wall biosynthesis
MSTLALVSTVALDRVAVKEAVAPRVAVVIPCFNEEASIGKVVRDFRTALPDARIYVFDNNSSDGSAEIARREGAIVRHEAAQGKGNVVRRMFAEVDADIYVMVDGDDTYDASSSPSLIHKLTTEHLDMVTGVRVTDWSRYRSGHRLGNLCLTWLVTRIFGRRTSDMLSGYRVFSRRFVKTFPLLSNGFEIETELTVHALEMRMPIGEIDTVYRDRPAHSPSKLSTFRDGFRILWLIGRLIREERPLPFFTVIAAALTGASIVLAVPLFITYYETGLVPRVPTAVLCAGLAMLSFLALTCGLILDTVTRGRRELKRLAYLLVPGPQSLSSES